MDSGSGGRSDDNVEVDRNRRVFDARLRSAAKRLRVGELRVQAMESPTATLGQLTGVDAYAIQAEYVALRMADGATPVGYKVGAGAEPAYGTIFDDRVRPSGSIIDVARLIRPAIEVEIGFVLSEALRGSNATPADVLAATSHVVPSFEIVDSRILGWGTGLADIAADNGHTAMVVLGDGRASPRELDLRRVGVILERNGQRVGTGSGAAVFGNPARSLAWLARELGASDHEIAPGSLVLSGAIFAPITARPGDEFRASIEGVGEVSCRFD